MDSIIEIQETWWQAVRIVAQLLSCDVASLENESALIETLRLYGFDEIESRKALEWFENVSMHGNLSDVLGMVLPESQNLRVDHPMERLFVSDELWSQIVSCRQRGIFTRDVTERLLEGIRALDTRDWEDEEVRAFIADVLGSLKDGSKDMISKLIKGRVPDFYS